MESVAQRMRDLDPHALVQCAYLELMQPDLDAAVRSLIAAGCTDVVVVPMFLGLGHHVRQDLPVMVAQLAVALPAVTIRLQAAIGEDARLQDLLAHIALG